MDMLYIVGLVHAKWEGKVITWRDLLKSMN